MDQLLSRSNQSVIHHYLWVGWTEGSPNFWKMHRIHKVSNFASDKTAPRAFFIVKFLIQIVLCSFLEYFKEVVFPCHFFLDFVSTNLGVDFQTSKQTFNCRLLLHF